jgi:hypothetical protein
MRCGQGAATAMLACERVDNALPTQEGGLLVELPFNVLDLLPFPACSGACTPVLQ